MARIWSCSATLELSDLADSIRVAGMPHSKIVDMPVKIRVEGNKPPSSETITKEALKAWDKCYSVEAIRVVSTYEGFILWDNI